MQFTQPEQLTGFITAITLLLGAIGKLVYDRYYPKGQAEPVGDDNTLGGGKMLKVYEILRDYVTVRMCDTKHDGICDKMELLREEIKTNRELYIESQRALSAEIKSLRTLVESRHAEGG